MSTAVLLPDGDSLAYASTSGGIFVVNATTGDRLWELNGFTAITSDLLLSPSGENLIFAVASGIVHSVSLKSKQTTWSYELEGGCV